MESVKTKEKTQNISGALNIRDGEDLIGKVGMAETAYCYWLTQLETMNHPKRMREKERSLNVSTSVTVNMVFGT